MIKITPEGTTGSQMADLGYITGRKGIARYVLPITRWLRAKNAERYITPQARLLDIGCGDGYFISRSKCQERYGLDKRLGDVVTDSLDFADEFFDYVTMLAVIEHIENPACLLKEIHRVLKPGGRLILTTPKKTAEFLIRLYVKDIGDEHESYFDIDRMRDLTKGLFSISGFHSFLLGLNQAFCLSKIVFCEPLRE